MRMKIECVSNENGEGIDLKVGKSTIEVLVKVEVETEIKRESK